jgi:hypothetical protein
MKEPVVFLHTTGGRRLTIRIGRDRICATAKGMVVIKKDNCQYEVRETMAEIEQFIRDLD